MKNYNVVLIEKPLEDGIVTNELHKMIEIVEETGIEEWLPIEISGENSTAIGFIDVYAAQDMNYEYDDLSLFITNILNDMNNETSNNEYKFSDINILMTRNLD